MTNCSRTTRRLETSSSIRGVRLATRAPRRGEALDQALLGQPGERLAQRDVADAELVGQAPLDEPVAGRVRRRSRSRPGSGPRRRRRGSGRAAGRWRSRRPPGSGGRCGRAPASGRWSGAGRGPPHGRPAGGRAAGRWGAAPACAGPGPRLMLDTSAKRLVTSSRLTTPSSSWRTRRLTFRSAPGTSRSEFAAAARRAASSTSSRSPRRCRCARPCRPAGPRWASRRTCPAFFGWPYASRPAATAPSDSSTRNGE